MAQRISNDDERQYNIIRQGLHDMTLASSAEPPSPTGSGAMDLDEDSESSTPPVEIDRLGSIIDVAAVERIIDYTFNDKLLCAEAFNQNCANLLVHHEGVWARIPKNLRLAIRGTSVMHDTLCDDWFERTKRLDLDLSLGNPSSYGDLKRAQLTTEAVAKAGFSLGLTRSLILDTPWNVVPDRMMARAVEALFGAIRHDAGAQNLEVVSRLMGEMGFFNHPILNHGTSANGATAQ